MNRITKHFVWICAILFALTLTNSPASAGHERVPAPPSCLAGDGVKPCFGPAQIRGVYHVTPLLKRNITGKGRTIAVVVSYGSSTIRKDLHAFDRAFSLPDPVLDIRSPLGTANPGPSGWNVETTLDVEWAHVMAPGARILLLTSPVDETEGTQGLPQFLKLERYALQHGADVISQSWGATEDTLLDAQGRSLVAQFHRLYTDAAARGVTVVTASGDEGAAGLDLSLKQVFPDRVVQWPAAEPQVLSVGGTQLTRSPLQNGETAWIGSGGGFSKMYAEPAYQQLLPPAMQSLLNRHRGVPDVSLVAGPLVVLFNGQWRLVGGTSASTPQWAGLIALADNLAGKRLGDIHPLLYRLAETSSYAKDFTDITAGVIKDPPALASKNDPLHAGIGWDPTTGLGTPIAASLIPDLVKAAGQ